MKIAMWTIKNEQEDIQKARTSLATFHPHNTTPKQESWEADKKNTQMTQHHFINQINKTHLHTDTKKQ